MWPVLNDPAIWAAIISPLITALLATGTVGLKSQQSARRADQERARIIGQATQEAAFINSWLSARQQLDLDADTRRTTNERALADLERVYATIRSVDINTNLRHGSRPLLRIARATLLVPLHRPWAKFFRVVYYVFTVCSLAFSIATTIAMFKSMPTSEVPEYVVVYILTAAFINILFLLPALGLWGFARALDRPRDRQPSQPYAPFVAQPAQARPATPWRQGQPPSEPHPAYGAPPLAQGAPSHQPPLRHDGPAS